MPISPDALITATQFKLAPGTTYLTTAGTLARGESQTVHKLSLPVMEHDEHQITAVYSGFVYGVASGIVSVYEGFSFFL
jgi:hypothetical protein